MAINELESVAANVFGDNLSAARATAHELALSYGDRDLTDHDRAMLALVREWQDLHEMLLDGEVTEDGDIRSATEKLLEVDDLVRDFRNRAKNLADILSGMNLGLIATDNGKRDSIGNLILTLVSDMSKAVITLDSARKQLEAPAQAADSEASKQSEAVNEFEENRPVGMASAKDLPLGITAPCVPVAQISTQARLARVERTLNRARRQMSSETPEQYRSRMDRKLARVLFKRKPGSGH